MATIKHFLAIPLFIGTLASCGLAVNMDARRDMIASRDQFKACLSQNPGNPAACEALREAYAADLNAYQATSTGISSVNRR